MMVARQDGDLPVLPSRDRYSASSSGLSLHLLRLVEDAGRQHIYAMDTGG